MILHLPITLTLAAAAAFINIWLAWRIGHARRAAKVLIGDGGDPRLTARMRAQANFVEYTPFVLILTALIEMAWGPSTWLWLVALVYVAARLVHPFGMEMAGLNKARMAGAGLSILVLLILAVTAAIAAYDGHGPHVPADPLSVRV